MSTSTSGAGRSGRPKGRVIIAVVVLALWLGGLGLLTRKEFFRPHLERLAEAALRVNQSTAFFGVKREGVLVGYASSIVDTTQQEIKITNYLVTEISGPRPRSTTRATIRLSRTLRLRDFETGIVTNSLNIKTTGRVQGDSLFLSISSDDKAPTTRRIHLDGPVLLPQLVPLGIALTQTPKVGKKYTFPVFDPARQAVVQIDSKIEAESMFVVPDSAMLNPTTRRWQTAHADTIRGWRVTSTEGGFNGWLDETGHVLRTTELGSDVVRMSFEESFDNWVLETTERRLQALPPAPNKHRPPKS